MSITSYRAVTPDEGDIPSYQGFGEHTSPTATGFADGPFGLEAERDGLDWDGPDGWDASDWPEPPSPPPHEAMPPNMALPFPPWTVCIQPTPGDSTGGGWREATFVGGFMHGFPPINITCDVVVGAPIVLFDGNRLPDRQAYREVDSALHEAGRIVQAWLSNGPGLAPSVAICNRFRAELSRVFSSSKGAHGRHGYRARQGIPCAF